MNIPEMSAMENIDYTTFTLEHSLEILNMVQEYTMETMHVELEFVRSCMETGFIPLLEEAAQKTGKAKEGIFERIKRAVKEFIERIKSMFTTRTKEKCEKYVPWVKHCKDIFSEVAKKHDPINMAPYWKGKYKEDCTVVINCMNVAFNNISSGKVDYDFAKPLLKDPSIIGETGNNVDEYLKNYFRFNTISTTEIRQVKITGTEISDMIGEVCDYILGYENSIPGNFDKMQAALNKNLERVKEPQSIKESIDEDTLLLVEGKPISETILATMVNYQSVCESKKNKNKNKKNNSGNAGNDEKDTTVVTPEGKDTTDDKNGKPKEINVTDVSSDKTDDDSNKDNTEGSSSDTDKEGATNNDIVEYYKNVVKFFETCISAYITACEERFITYCKLLMEISRATGRAPKFDKDGKYIPPEQRDTKSVDMVETRKTDDKTDKSNKSKGKIRNFFKDKFGKKKDNKGK